MAFLLDNYLITLLIKYYIGVYLLFFCFLIVTKLQNQCIG